MPKIALCTTCAEKHEPPRGVNCTRVLTKLAASMEALQAEVLSLKKTVNLPPRQTARATTSTEQDDEDDEGGAAATHSAASLRGDAALQEAVTKRLQALGIADAEDSSGDEDEPKVSKTKRAKSGRKRTAADLVKVAVEWPHYHTYRGPGKDMAAYDDLTVTEFVHGFVTTLLASHADARDKNTQLRHLQHLMLDATDYGWEAARHAHGVILQEMEAGRITWADEDNIQELRHLYCQRFVRSNPSAPSHAAPNMTKGPLFCLSFQNDKCPFDGDHNTTRGRVRHICAYCLRVQGAAFKHSEAACRRKAAKNEASTRPSAESPP